MATYEEVRKVVTEAYLETKKKIKQNLKFAKQKEGQEGKDDDADK